MNRVVFYPLPKICSTSGVIERGGECVPSSLWRGERKQEGGGP